LTQSINQQPPSLLITPRNYGFTVSHKTKMHGSILNLNVKCLFMHAAPDVEMEWFGVTQDLGSYVTI